MEQIQTILEQLGPWAWWIAGLILLCLEILVPVNVPVWLGIAAMLTGLEILIIDFGWQVSLAIFVVLSVVLLIVGRRNFGRDSEGGASRPASPSARIS